MKKTKLFIAIPSTGTVCDEIPFQLEQLRKRYDDEIEFVYPKACVNRMFHDFARNGLVKEFLESDADVLWFLDSDVVPKENCLDLITIYGDRWQLAGCPYPVFITTGSEKKQKVAWCVYRNIDGGLPTYADVPMEGTDFVDGMATGCIFIKREVLEKLSEPYFEFIFEPNTRNIKIGEDLGFCMKVNQLGYKFFIDYSLHCNHYKKVGLLQVNNYAIDYARRTLETYKAAVRAELMARAEKVREQPKLWVPDSKILMK